MSKWWSRWAEQKGIRYKRRQGIGTSSRRCDNTLSSYSFPPFLYPLYTDVPLNATYGSPFRKVASRIFVGWAISLHVVDNGLPFRPRPFIPPSSTTAVSHSLHLAARWTWGKGSWEGGGGLRSPLEGERGCAALIPAARFRSQFSRALTRLFSLLASPPVDRSSSISFTAYPLPSLSFSFPSPFRHWGSEDYRWKEVQKIQLAVDWPPNRFCTRNIKGEKERRKKVAKRGCPSISYSRTRLIWKYNSPALSQYRGTIDGRIVFWFMPRYLARNVSNDPRSVIHDFVGFIRFYGRKTWPLVAWHILTVIGETMICWLRHKVLRPVFSRVICKFIMNNYAFLCSCVIIYLITLEKSRSKAISTFHTVLSAIIANILRCRSFSEIAVSRGESRSSCRRDGSSQRSSEVSSRFITDH